MEYDTQIRYTIEQFEPTITYLSYKQVPMTNVHQLNMLYLFHLGLFYCIPYRMNSLADPHTN